MTPFHGRGRDCDGLETESADLREQLRRLEEELEGLPDVNATKVVALHNRISAGKYKIDAERVAQKCLALEAEIHGG